MIKALLKSEWIKFRSYYLASGAALVALERSIFSDES